VSVKHTILCERKSQKEESTNVLQTRNKLFWLRK
jgi:hypothetical protein